MKWSWSWPVEKRGSGGRERVAADRLLAAERAELLDKPAPECLAYLLASAGLDANQAVQTFRELGIDSTVAATALTAVYP